MKKSIFIFGMGLLALTSANAKNGKTDNSKTTDAVAAPAESKAKDGATYYWFATNAAGTALTDPSGIPTSQGQSEEGLCGGTMGDVCSKGFLPSQTSIVSGKRVPTPGIPISSGETDLKD